MKADIGIVMRIKMEVARESPAKSSELTLPAIRVSVKAIPVVDMLPMKIGTAIFISLNASSL